MYSHIHKKPRINARQDRISKLPDELIHHILLFLDARFAVQTCILSKRWKLIWTTLPFLSFDERIGKKGFLNFLDSIFLCRNHDSNILKLKLQVRNRGVSSDELADYVKYAMRHNVQDLHVEKCECDDLILESNSLKTLYLATNFDRSFMSSDYCWYLPALTSLHVKQLSRDRPTLPESYLTCLSALRNLSLEGFELPHLLSFPGLKTLHLKSCETHNKLVWDLPALISLELDGVEIDTNGTEFLSTLVNLQNLKLSSCFGYLENYLINCPQLLSLELRTTNWADETWIPNIFVIAPKLSDVSIVGFFSIRCSGLKLENVNVRLHGCIRDKTKITWGTLKHFYCHLVYMLGGLGSAKILTLDSDTIEALSSIVDLLRNLSSPFHNLKYMKLPQGYKESSMCGPVRNYLLGGSAGVTILGQNDVIPKIAPVPPTSENGMLDDPLASPAIDLVDSQGIHSNVCASGVVEKVGALVPGFGGLVSDAPESCNWRASSSKGNNDSGFWKGHEVKPEFVGLLDLIMKKYPQTFEQFTTSNKMLRTMKLNMLCTSIIALSTIPMTEINTEIITEYRTLFSYLHRSFNVKWLVSHLNNIERSLFSQHELNAITSCVGDAKHQFQVLNPVGAQKNTKVEEAFRTVGANLDASVSYTGDVVLQDLTTAGVLQDLTTAGAQKTPEVEEVDANLDSSVGSYKDDLSSDPRGEQVTTHIHT